MMKLMGKCCRSIVSGYEGICTGVLEYMYGCELFRLQAKGTETAKKPEPQFFYEKELEVIGDGIEAEIPKVDEPQFFGKECRDKVTGFKGVCVGRIINLFSGEQYILEYQPEDQSKEARMVWLDEGRIEIIGEQVKKEEVKGSRPGGVLVESEYPDRQVMPGQQVL